MKRPVFALVLVVVASAYAFASQQRDLAGRNPEGTGVVTGVVTTAGDAPQPVRRAVVSLSGTPLRTTLLAVTDAQGRFVFRSLPVGRFSLDARKAGYVRAVYGAVTVGATEGVPLVVNSDTTDVALSLVRSASISGRLLMPPGAPVTSIRLQVLRWSTVSGRRRLVSTGGAYGADGSGRFRIGGLPPGEYVVAAYPFRSPAVRLFDADGPGAGVGMAPVYSPGTTDPSQARSVTLAPGESRELDLPMDFVQTGLVAGRVFGPDGLPAQGVQVSAVSDHVVVGVPPQVTSGADGRFVLPPLVPGTFTLVARGAPVDGARAPAGVIGGQPYLPLVARTDVMITPGSRIEETGLHLAAGRSVRGRIVLTSGAVPPVAGIVVFLEGEDSSVRPIGVPAVSPSGDGMFEVPGVAPGRYRLRVAVAAQQQQSLFVIGMVAGAQDVLDAPVVVASDRDTEVAVTMSTEPSVVHVSAQDADGAAVAGAPVVVFARDAAMRAPQSRRVVFARTGADGVAVVRALPDGGYFVAAIPAVPAEADQTVDWFESIAATATRLDVHDGRTAEVTVRPPGR